MAPMKPRANPTSPVKSYEDLIAWQKAMDLANEVYKISARFPDREVCGLTAQLQRAAVSVPSNIAEGQGRLTRGEFKQFLGHARGSLYEVQTQLRLANRLGYLAPSELKRVLELSFEVGRILHGLLASLG